MFVRPDQVARSRPWFISFMCVLALAGAAILAPAARAAEDPLPTQDELHQLFDQQKYSQVLQKLQRVLILKGIAAKPYDRHDLLRLRGEASLRLKMPQQAEQAFTEASKEAVDPNDRALDLATQLLIHRSPAAQYQPKSKGSNGKMQDVIPILDPEKRKGALAALFRDELLAEAPRIKAVRDSKSLPPIMQVMPTIASLRILELAATGGQDDETKKVTSDLAKHAEGLMGDAVQAMAKDVDAMDKYANALIEYNEIVADPAYGTRAIPRWRKRGLQAKDQQEMRNVESTCDLIVPASREFSDTMGTDGSGFDAVRTAAEKVGRKADQILNADYRGVYNNPSGT
jgi:hypothetical protein